MTQLSAICVLLVVLLTGCAGGPAIKITAADKAVIKSVSAGPNPPLPADMFFNGRAQAFAAVGGAIGAAMAASVAVEPKSKLLDVMKANNIELSKILTSEFFGTAESRGLFKQSESSASQAEIVLTVNGYGFGQTQGFSALLYPIINVTATMKRHGGEVVWQRTDFVVPLNADNKFGYEFERYIQEPELLRKTLTNISGIVSRMLLDAYASGG